MNMHETKNRILNRCEYDSDTGCLNWKGSVTRDGYGTIFLDRTVRRVHRVMYSICVRDIPKGKVVRHSCDNPKCCNPDHLLIGTQYDNVQDCIKRGRFMPWGGTGTRPKSESHKDNISKAVKEYLRKRREAGNPRITSSKISEATAKQIKRRLGEYPVCRHVAREFGVSESIVSNIKRGRCWSHV